MTPEEQKLFDESVQRTIDSKIGFPSMPGTEQTVIPPISLGLYNRPARKQSNSQSTKTVETQTQTVPTGYENPFPMPEKPAYNFDENTNIISQIMKMQTPKPLTDEENQKRLKNRAFLNGLGRVFTNIGDSMTLGMGGTPVRRNPDNTDNYIDRYYQSVAGDRAKQEAWNTNEYLRKLKAATMAVENNQAANKLLQDDYQNSMDNYLKGEGMAFDKQKFTREQTERERSNRAEEGLKGRDATLREKEFKQKYGDETVTYEAASGQKITRKIPFPEQRDIVSKAKQDQKFKEYAKGYFKATPVRITDPESVTGYRTEYVDEFGRNIKDQDLLQAYLRYQTEGSPNNNWANLQNPGVNTNEFMPNYNSGSTQQEEIPIQDNQIDYSSLNY